MDSSVLHADHETLGAAVVVRVEGEIDMLTAPQLRSFLHQACQRARPPQVVVADLTRVRFLGSSGIAELLEAHASCGQRRTPLYVVATSPVVLRPLSLTGVDRELRVVGSVDSAVHPA